MLQLFRDLCYHMRAISKMGGGGGYQRVKMSKRLSEGGIVVGWGESKCLERGCPDTADIYISK